MSEPSERLQEAERKFSDLQIHIHKDREKLERLRLGTIVLRMKESGRSDVDIARRIGMSASSVRLFYEEAMLAEPKLEIEQRMDRVELAIGTMALRLVGAEIGFNAKDAEGISKILRGEILKDLDEEIEKEPEEDKARTEAHERWEEEDASPEEQGRV